MTLYPIDTAARPLAAVVAPPRPLPPVPPSPAPLPLVQDAYIASAPALPGQEGPGGMEDRVLRFLPFISLPVPMAAPPSASFGAQIFNTGGQVFRWLQGSAGSLYSQAMTFFTGSAPAAPPGWLNPAHYPSANPLRQQVVTNAHRYLGVPYVWGGETPKGFDCSGLVQYVYRQAGVSLPRTAAAQARVGIPVFSKADLQPGDAVFLKGTRGPNPNAVTHVGLYIGGGKMIVAPHTGANVRIESIDGGLWASHKYAGARRYIA